MHAFTGRMPLSRPYQAPDGPSISNGIPTAPTTAGSPKATAISLQSHRPSGSLRPKTTRLQAPSAVHETTIHCETANSCKKNPNTEQTRGGGLSLAYSM